MNQTQRDLIAEKMDALFANDPATQDYQSRWTGTLERFFVKNLENVQGDERDVIFLSTVYGPDADGHFRQNFGPINREVGHRRLNVLFTRAKRQVVLFTSMKAEEIHVEPHAKLEVKVLRDYLRYAASGTLDSNRPTGRNPDSDFERWFVDRLRSANYNVVPQLGVKNYYIDIAVEDPACPGSFILGIECDGATYHSAKSARDRDRLRQQVLEDLGWNIYRVWSTDWFRNADGELAKLLARLHELTRRPQIS